MVHILAEYFSHKAGSRIQQMSVALGEKKLVLGALESPVLVDWKTSQVELWSLHDSQENCIHDRLQLHGLRIALSRIEQVIKDTGLTQSAFAKRINENPTKFSHIFKGRNRPSLDLIMKIATTFPSIHLEWLVLGKGTAWDSQNQTVETPSHSINTEEMNSVQSDVVIRGEVDGLLPFDIIEHNEISGTSSGVNEPMRGGIFEQKETRSSEGVVERENVDEKRESSARTGELEGERVREWGLKKDGEWDSEREREQEEDVKETSQQAAVRYSGVLSKNKKIKRIILLYDDNSFDDYVK